jgi:hypothetical protein
MTKLALAAVAVAAGTYAHAAELRANIPFEFKVGAKQMPAGEYRLKVDGSGSILLRGEKLSAFRIMKTAMVPLETNLLFDCSRGTCSFQDLVPAREASPENMTAATRTVVGTPVAGN